MLRSAEKWMPGYVRSLLRRPRTQGRPAHLVFCVADHYEPLGYGASPEKAHETVQRWVGEYPRRFGHFRDGDGRPPQHTFFYPGEAYDRRLLDTLAGLCGDGLAEIEVHLHHRDDDAAGLTEKLVRFRDALRDEHGLLGSDRAGAVRYGFIHGNWALCNSHPAGDWCGVNEELRILRETGCYADFTFPSAPSATQPRMVNAIYRAVDRPGHPRSHDTGRLAIAGEKGIAPSDDDDSLLLITGPLALNWNQRKWGVLPRLENGDLTGANPPTPDRADLWMAQHIHVRGRPEWVFVKVYAHGAVPKNEKVLLGDPMVRLYEYLTMGDKAEKWALHFVSAREMANIVRAAEMGCEGNPSDYRDYIVGPPPRRG